MISLRKFILNSGQLHVEDFSKNIAKTGDGSFLQTLISPRPAFINQYIAIRLKIIIERVLTSRIGKTEKIITKKWSWMVAEETTQSPKQCWR